MGWIAHRSGDRAAAVDLLRQSLDVDPNNAGCWNNLGIVFVRQQDFSRAEEQFRSGIRVAPNFDQSYLNLARLYAMRSDKEKARAVLEDLLRLQPANAGAKQALELLQ